MVADSVTETTFYSPYSRRLGSDQQMAGIELHAHMVRQLLEIGLNNDPLTRSLSEELEWGWILFLGSHGVAVLGSDGTQSVALHPTREVLEG